MSDRMTGKAEQPLPKSTKLLLVAYARAAEGGPYEGQVRWEDLDAAFHAACEEVGIEPDANAGVFIDMLVAHPEGGT